MSDVSAHTTQLNQWMNRIRAGDLTARDELFRSVADRLKAMAERMLRDFPRVQRWAETDDVLQNAYLRLLRTLEQVEINSMRGFYGLAAAQIRRELIDLARHFSGPENQAAHHDSAFPASALPAAEPASQLQLWTAFHEAVEQLPAEEREVVGLVYYHNWTQAQIAEMFQVHLRTVRRWWQSALGKLKHVLQGMLPED